MLKDAVAIVDLGTYNLTCLIGENGINNNFIIRAMHECRHDAFEEGYISERRLADAISDGIRVVTHSAKAKLDKVYVGIPGEFLRVQNVERPIYFNRKRKVREKDLTEFYNVAQASVKTGEYRVISRTGICFYVDGNMRTDNVLGIKTSSIRGYVTLMLARENLLKMLERIFAALGIKKVEFIPVPLAEGKLLFTQEERRGMQILVDAGYLSTDLTVLSGDGALFHHTIDVGGGHVTAHLFNTLKVNFEVCEKLKRKINLSIDNDLGDYVVVYGDKQYNFAVRTCNEVVREVIDSIAADFENALSASHIRFPHNISVSLTGGGLAYIRGGAQYLARHIEMPVYVVSPKISYMSKPDDSSALSVLNYALNEKFY